MRALGRFAGRHPLAYTALQCGAITLVMLGTLVILGALLALISLKLVPAAAGPLRIYFTEEDHHA